MVLRIAYTIFLGLIVATFIGVGIAAFYRAPKMPETSVSKVMREPSATEAATLEEEKRRDQRRWEENNKVQKLYDRNVSAIALSFAVVLLIVSLIFFKQIAIISDGLLLGSVFTLLYSIVRGFNADDEMFRFIVVAVGLVIALFLGYIKFVKPQHFTNIKKQL